MAAGIRRDGLRQQCACGRRGRLTYLGGLTPVVKRREFCRGIAFPCIITLKPILPDAVKTGISGGIKAERMAPSLRVCRLEGLVVDPLDQAEPEILSFSGM